MEPRQGSDRNPELNPTTPSGPAAGVPAGNWLIRRGPSLLIFGGLLAYLFYKVDAEVLFNISKAAIGLGFVVFIHELGHFLVAKWCDVHVETFSVGFGPALPGCSFRWGETKYMIGVLPLGGYVKMVGEGPDTEDGDEDPRSFKNKPVWQRMAIISAGVTMNILLALAFFVFVFQTHGDEQPPGVIDLVDAGSPAWKVGARSGDVIEWIGNKGPYPTFEALLPTVMFSGNDEKLRFVFGAPGAPDSEMIHTEVQPRRHPDDLRPVIGIKAPPSLDFPPPPRFHQPNDAPVMPGSAADAASPPFQYGDAVIGSSTDSTKSDDVTPLPPDPRNPAQLDYFEFYRRLRLLTGEKMTIQVRRRQGGEVVNIQVPPAYHRTLGLCMRMGKVTALRDRSPAAAAGVREQDIIEYVEVQNNQGLTVCYAASPKIEGLPKGATVKELDPVRLPFELEQWAAGGEGEKIVTLHLIRTNPPPQHDKLQKTVVQLKWDDRWRFDKEVSFSPYSPTSIPELGIAYQVEATVQAVRPGSPATRAHIESSSAPNVAVGATTQLRPDDLVKAFRLEVPDEKNPGQLKFSKWQDIKPDEWAWTSSIMLMDGARRVGLRLDRDNLELTLDPERDEDWPMTERGMVLIADKQLLKAANLGDALRMGVDKTSGFIMQVFGTIRSISSGRVSPKAIGGPVLIAAASYEYAGRDIYQFLIFLGIIGVNLAVVNFLPIPMLDGGHMVFLIYEKLRGKPAPEGVRNAALYVGLAFILCLFVTVMYLDLSRLFF